MSEETRKIESDVFSSPITDHASLLPGASPVTHYSSLPRISVVIATLNRPQLLDRCLGVLFDQTLPHAVYEIVVVDDGPHPATESVVHDWRRRCPNCAVQ